MSLSSYNVYEGGGIPYGKTASFQLFLFSSDNM